ncbi:MAG: DUF1697 domain-containing protein [Gemmatimonadetes bacterium]|nr:DUF1697 domain-containing protein [Gemmatimonadota bacterium]
MPRYVAFLRGVMPTNCRMADLRAAFEAGGFANVKTVLASGNVAFDARQAPVATLERKVEAAIVAGLGRTFETFVRPNDMLQAMLDRDPFAPFRLPADAKRVVTFLRTPPVVPKLPLVLNEARIVAVEGCELFTTYQRGAETPDFMKLIEQAVGKQQTTRTWDTVRKCAQA